MDKAAQYAKAAELYKAALAEGTDPEEARAAYDAAVARIAAAPDAPQASAPAASPTVVKPLSDREKLVGRVRAGAGGMSYGYADEAEGAVRAALDPNLDYKTARDQVRNEQARYQAQAPWENVGLEIAGGALTSGGLKAAFKNGSGALARGAVNLATGGAGKGLATRAASLVGAGALAGTGASTAEDAGGIAADAAMGGVAGGVIGMLSTAVGQQVGTQLTRLRGSGLARSIGKAGDAVQRSMGIARQSTTSLAGRAADALTRLAGRAMSDVPEGELAPTWAGRRAVAALTRRSNGQITPEVLEQAGGYNTAQGATILDNMGHEGERIARGLRTRGGPAGTKIDTWAESRLRTAADKMTDAVYSGETPDNVAQITRTIAQRAKDVSKPLYDKFRSLPPVYDDQIEEMLKERPLFQEAVKDAVRNIKNKNPKDRLEILGQHVVLPDDEMATLRTPGFLDAVKKAAGDIVYSRKDPAAGGLKPNAIADEKAALKDFTNRLDEVFKDKEGQPIYKLARDAWAGETELNEAVKDGMRVIENNVHYNEIPFIMQDMSGSERDMFKRGVKAQIFNVIERGGLKPGSTEQRAFIKRVEAALGDDAREVMTRIRDEVAAVRTAQNIKLGTQTADKNLEAINPFAPETSNAWAAGFYNPTRAVANVVGKFTGDRLAAPIGRETSLEAANMLLSPANDPRVTRLILSDMAARNAGRKMAGPAGAALSAETSYGFFRRPPEEKKR